MPSSSVPLVVDQLRLQGDDMSRLRLNLSIEYCVRHHFEEILDAVRDNHVVSTLYLGPYFYSSLTDEQRALFVETVGRECKQLSVWTITTLEQTVACFSGNSIGRALGTARCLQTLRIERTLLIEDVTVLAAGLSHHPSLRRITLSCLQPIDNCHDSGDPKPTVGILDPLIAALGTIPKLESLELSLEPKCHLKYETTNVGTVATPLVLASLANHSTLTWLVVNYFHLNDAHVQAFATALTGRPSNLKNLNLRLNPNITKTAWVAVADMLASNSRLEMVDLLPQAGIDKHKETAQLYLRLNGKGRHHLWSTNASKEEWIKVLSDLRHDLSAIMILLRGNPVLCHGD